MMMEIGIDHEKCPMPITCRKCVQVCPQCVFRLHPTHLKKFEEIPPEHWELRVSFADLCAGCMECVKICPVHAIKVRPVKDQPREVASA